ncbi:aaa domain protein [Cystoisospora suis]|uniref:Aaa domain protein n=1 Tax=Cystoisospora suis TaxID=483139 RepID=A0A2C6LA79_9APIC|nr:aaa domain protein [Cystoisospora suis]
MLSLLSSSSSRKGYKNRRLSACHHRQLVSLSTPSFFFHSPSKHQTLSVIKTGHLATATPNALESTLYLHPPASRLVRPPPLLLLSHPSSFLSKHDISPLFPLLSFISRLVSPHLIPSLSSSSFSCSPLTGRLPELSCSPSFSSLPLTRCFSLSTAHASVELREEEKPPSRSFSECVQNILPSAAPSALAFFQEDWHKRRDSSTSLYPTTTRERLQQDGKHYDEILLGKSTTSESIVDENTNDISSPHHATIRRRKDKRRKDEEKEKEEVVRDRQLCSSNDSTAIGPFSSSFSRIHTKHGETDRRREEALHGVYVHPMELPSAHDDVSYSSLVYQRDEGETGEIHERRGKKKIRKKSHERSTKTDMHVEQEGKPLVLPAEERDEPTKRDGISLQDDIEINVSEDKEEKTSTRQRRKTKKISRTSPDPLSTTNSSSSGLFIPDTLFVKDQITSPNTRHEGSSSVCTPQGGFASVLVDDHPELREKKKKKKRPSTERIQNERSIVSEALDTSLSLQKTSRKKQGDLLVARSLIAWREALCTKDRRLRSSLISSFPPSSVLTPSGKKKRTRLEEERQRQHKESFDPVPTSADLTKVENTKKNVLQENRERQPERASSLSRTPTMASSFSSSSFSCSPSSCGSASMAKWVISAKTLRALALEGAHHCHVAHEALKHLAGHFTLQHTLPSTPYEEDGANAEERRRIGERNDTPRSSATGEKRMREEERAEEEEEKEKEQDRYRALHAFLKRGILDEAYRLASGFRQSLEAIKRDESPGAEIRLLSFHASTREGEFLLVNEDIPSDWENRGMRRLLSYAVLVPIDEETESLIKEARKCHGDVFDYRHLSLSSQAAHLPRTPPSSPPSNKGSSILTNFSVQSSSSASLTGSSIEREKKRKNEDDDEEEDIKSFSDHAKVTKAKQEEKTKKILLRSSSESVTSFSSSSHPFYQSLACSNCRCLFSVELDRLRDSEESISCPECHATSRRSLKDKEERGGALTPSEAERGRRTRREIEVMKKKEKEKMIVKRDWTKEGRGGEEDVHEAKETSRRRGDREEDEVGDKEEVSTRGREERELKGEEEEESSLLQQMREEGRRLWRQLDDWRYPNFKEKKKKVIRGEGIHTSLTSFLPLPPPPPLHGHSLWLAEILSLKHGLSSLKLNARLYPIVTEEEEEEHEGTLSEDEEEEAGKTSLFSISLRRPDDELLFNVKLHPSLFSSSPSPSLPLSSSSSSLPLPEELGDREGKKKKNRRGREHPESCQKERNEPSLCQGEDSKRSLSPSSCMNESGVYHKRYYIWPLTEVVPTASLRTLRTLLKLPTFFSASSSSSSSFCSSHETSVKDSDRRREEKDEKDDEDKEDHGRSLRTSLLATREREDREGREEGEEVSEIKNDRRRLLPKDKQRSDREGEVKRNKEEKKKKDSEGKRRDDAPRAPTKRKERRGRFQEIREDEREKNAMVGQKLIQSNCIVNDYEEINKTEEENKRNKKKNNRNERIHSEILLALTLPSTPSSSSLSLSPSSSSSSSLLSSSRPSLRSTSLALPSALSSSLSIACNGSPPPLPGDFPFTQSPSSSSSPSSPVMASSSSSSSLRASKLSRGSPSLSDSVARLSSRNEEKEEEKEKSFSRSPSIMQQDDSEEAESLAENFYQTDLTKATPPLFVSRDSSSSSSSLRSSLHLPHNSHHVEPIDAFSCVDSERGRSSSEETAKETPSLPLLTKCQRDIIHHVLTSSSSSVILIQGPPGTGKTTVAASILKGWSMGLDGDNRSPIFAGTGTIAALNALRMQLDTLGKKKNINKEICRTL